MISVSLAQGFFLLDKRTTNHYLFSLLVKEGKEKIYL